MAPTQSSRTDGSRQDSPMWHPTTNTIIHPQGAVPASDSLRSSTTNSEAPIFAPIPIQLQHRPMAGPGPNTTETALGVDRPVPNYLAKMDEYISRLRDPVVPLPRRSGLVHSPQPRNHGLSERKESKGPEKGRDKEQKCRDQQRRHQDHRVGNPTERKSHRDAAIEALTATMNTFSIGSPERRLRQSLIRRLLNRDPEKTARRCRRARAELRRTRLMTAPPAVVEQPEAGGMDVDGEEEEKVEEEEKKGKWHQLLASQDDDLQRYFDQQCRADGMEVEVGDDDYREDPGNEETMATDVRTDTDTIYSAYGAPPAEDEDDADVQMMSSPYP